MSSPTEKHPIIELFENKLGTGFNPAEQTESPTTSASGTESPSTPRARSTSPSDDGSQISSTTVLSEEFIKNTAKGYEWAKSDTELWGQFEGLVENGKLQRSQLTGKDRDMYDLWSFLNGIMEVHKFIIFRQRVEVATQNVSAISAKLEAGKPNSAFQVRRAMEEEKSKLQEQEEMLKDAVEKAQDFWLNVSAYMSWKAPNVEGWPEVEDSWTGIQELIGQMQRRLFPH